MKQEIAHQWIAALRSGDYKQGVGQLRDNRDNFCCLGVLCDVVMPACWKTELRNGNLRYLAFGQSGALPDLIRDLTGVKDKLGFVDGKPTLATLNDSHNLSFSEIADFIEDHWDQL